MNFSKIKSKNVCVVKDCISNKKPNADLMFYNFPRENLEFFKVEKENGGFEILDKLTVWKLSVGNDVQITKESKICSNHFTDEDFKRLGKQKQIILKSCF